jgi:hypothetical protein
MFFNPFCKKSADVEADIKTKETGIKHVAKLTTVGRHKGYLVQPVVKAPDMLELIK